MNVTISISGQDVPLTGQRTMETFPPWVPGGCGHWPLYRVVLTLLVKSPGTLSHKAQLTVPWALENLSMSEMWMFIMLSKHDS